MSRAVGIRVNREDGAPLKGIAPLSGYLEKSQAPLTCLLFLLPLLVMYEGGTTYFAADGHRLLAFQYMQRFFHWCGASGKYLPALAVGAILVSWHVARKDPWNLDFGTAGCMILESIALSLPLFVLDALSTRYVTLMSAPDTWPSQVVLCLGAGIYEELIFRLGLLTLMSLLFTDMLGMPKKRAIPVMVLISSVLFAFYHYGEMESFAWPTFAFRTAAGIYFSVLFFWRGFGVTAGSHAAYDLLAVTLGAMSSR